MKFHQKLAILLIFSTRFTSAKKLVYKFWTIMLHCEASTGSNPLG